MSAKTQHHNAFTLVELLAVIAIISLLLSIALPGLNKARINARIAADRASLRNIGVAVEQFAGDIGHYPESGQRDTIRDFSSLDTTCVNRDPLSIVGMPSSGTTIDQGAHRLYEALAGMDMMGYQKEHHYEVYNNQPDAPATTPVGAPIAYNKIGTREETQRYGPYVDLESMKSSTMQKSHLNSINFGTTAAPNNTNPVFIGTLQRTENRPILYYKAIRNNRMLYSSRGPAIYNYWDNASITQDAAAGVPYHPDFDNDSYPAVDEFADHIWDPDTGVGANPGLKIISPYARPYNKDTFILIHPGLDNLYGTADDITNYEVKPITSN